MSHTAFIVQGGAMRGAFAAGVLYEFGKRGLYPDTIAAASSSVPTSAYYAARQLEDIRTLWLKEAATSRLIRYDNMLLGKPIYDIEYLVGTLMQQKHPLDAARVIGSSTRVVVPLYDYVKAQLELRTSRDEDFEKNLWTYMHLAVIVHDHHILYGTPFEPYVDGALDPFALYKLPVAPQGARYVLIWNELKPGMHLIKYLGQIFFVAFQSRNFPPEVQRMLRARTQLIADGMEVYNKFCQLNDPVVIRPRNNLLAGFDVISRSKKHMEELFEEGRQKARDAIESGQLQGYFDHVPEIQHRDSYRGEQRERRERQSAHTLHA